MAKPRVFVSSTYYDLKYIRASLELFIESLGFDPILSEKGDIAYASDRPLDESCYREVENSDMFVLIVGGRYGSEAGTGSREPKAFYDRYESITKKEYGTAADRDIPIFVLIERAVYAEYQTFSCNKHTKGVKYAHVESVNVFRLIDDILARPRNNPVQPFEKFEDIESWLREQWAGLFRELLRRQSQQQQLIGLSQQVLQLKETNETLKKYLEALMRGVGKQETSKLIASEEKRLSDLRNAAFRRNAWVEYVLRQAKGIDEEGVAKALREAAGFEGFAENICRASDDQSALEHLKVTLRRSKRARDDLNEARDILNLPPFSIPEAWADTSFPPTQLSLRQRESGEGPPAAEAEVRASPAANLGLSKKRKPKSSRRSRPMLEPPQDSERS